MEEQKETEKLTFVEFQGTGEYKEILESSKADFPEMGDINRTIAISAWYEEIVLGNELPKVEKPEPITGEAKLISFYTPEEHLEKFGDILKEDTNMIKQIVDEPKVEELFEPEELEGLFGKAEQNGVEGEVLPLDIEECKKE